MTSSRNSNSCVSLADLEYDKKTKILHGYSNLFGGHFPREITVQSHHTNVELVFRSIATGHPLYDEDGWDGEQAIYAPIAETPNVYVLKLCHAY